jgi:hypothetical protein
MTLTSEFFTTKLKILIKTVITAYKDQLGMCY